MTTKFEYFITDIRKENFHSHLSRIWDKLGRNNGWELFCIEVDLTKPFHERLIYKRKKS